MSSQKGIRERDILVRAAAVVVLILTVVTLSACENQLAQNDTPQFAPMPPIQDTFTRTVPGTALQFPRDFGAHNDFQTEWWYYTGNLADESGRRFGYQLTFFRRAVVTPEDQNNRASNWAVDQVYLAHFTVTDVSDNQFYYFERFSRGAAGLAGAQSSPVYRVWLENWGVDQTGENEYRLTAEAEGVRLDLKLEDVRGVILQGNEGYSQKGQDAGNASYYYSQPRLKSSGQITINGSSYAVDGYSWKDHEFSTSALSGDQTGWNWFSMQLDNDSEIMVFNILRADGKPDTYSSGAVISSDGMTSLLKVDDFTISAVDTWQSPHSGAVYPSGWDVAIPAEDIQLRITPLIPDQELNLAFTYWEGAVKISGEIRGEPVTGYGYVELTGYVGSMAGQF